MEWIEKTPNWHQAESQGYVLNVTKNPESEGGWDWSVEGDILVSSEAMTLVSAKIEAQYWLNKVSDYTTKRTEVYIDKIFEEYRAKAHSILGDE